MTTPVVSQKKSRAALVDGAARSTAQEDQSLVAAAMNTSTTHGTSKPVKPNDM